MGRHRKGSTMRYFHARVSRAWITVLVGLVVAVMCHPTPHDDYWEETSEQDNMQASYGGESKASKQWKQWIASGWPQEAKDVAGKLSTRAISKVQQVLTNKKLGDIDVVVSGGGNFDGYYMGVSMILQKLQGTTARRWAGASAGGMMPFEEALMGQPETLLLHLSF